VWCRDVHNLLLAIANWVCSHENSKCRLFLKSDVLLSLSLSFKQGARTAPIVFFLSGKTKIARLYTFSVQKGFAFAPDAYVWPHKACFLRMCGRTKSATHVVEL
jgi:hypothetical protein